MIAGRPRASSSDRGRALTHALLHTVDYEDSEAPDAGVH